VALPGINLQPADPETDTLTTRPPRQGVQRRAAKLISDLKDYAYEERLSILNLTTLG